MRQKNLKNKDNNTQRGKMPNLYPKGIEKDLDALIAVSIYKTKSENMKRYLRSLMQTYKPYLKPIDKLRKGLAKEISGLPLSEEVIRMRKRELF